MVAQLLFGRGLALACFVAFWSLALQVEGLYGSHGILPVVDFLAEATQWGARTGRNPGATFLSIFWLDASDGMLRGATDVGMLLSALLFFGVAPRLVIPCLWLLYLSFASVGQIFMGYQWDALLLEALFVGWFFVPWRMLPSRSPPALRAGRWLIWILTLKLMLLAGMVKIGSDEVWRNLTALDYHFWTQPVPNSVAWYADKLPAWIKACGVLFTLVAETVAPLLIIAPRRFRHGGALAMIALQLMIMATGTFGFFNLLTIALCASLFDDAFFRFDPDQPANPARRRFFATMILVAPLVGFTPVLPDAVRDTLAPLRTFNTYGLFAQMTKERPEVAVEWSNDGRKWQEYDFQWKPTRVDEPLRFTTFHMPRLDWQLWFAALRGCRRATWLPQFAERLLAGSEGAPEVHALLEGGYPQQAPKFVRMSYSYYRFGEEQAWTRGARGEFCPAWFMVDETGRLVQANPEADVFEQHDETTEARLAMVKKQIADRGVANAAVLEAMRKVPREQFMPHQWRDRAYADAPSPIGFGQTISQPYIVGFMTELLQVSPGQKVLEIGTGSGYQAAVLAETGAEVYSIEIVEELAEQAKAVLQELGYAVHLRTGDGYRGWPDAAPFDRVIVTAAPPELPQALVDQLAPGGRMVVPVGEYWQNLDLVTKDAAGAVSVERVLPVQFVPMVHGE